MPSIYTGALSLSQRFAKRVANNKSFQKALFSSSDALINYLGYESSKRDDYDYPEPVPTLGTTVPEDVTVKNNPPIDKVVNDFIKTTNANVEKSDANFKIMATNLDVLQKNLSNQVDSFASALPVGASPLLGHQIAMVDSINSIALNFEAHNIMLGELWLVLQNNLSALVSMKMIEAQNAKVLTDYQKQIAANSDYGDSEYFYAFEPTYEYWAKVDIAYQLYWQKQGSVYVGALPSESYASNEIDLIDRMSGTSSKSDIRKAIEVFRKSNVNSDIRALIGQTLVAAKTSESEKAKVETELAKKSLESLTAKETAAADVGGDVGVATVDALNALTVALNPVSQWAQKAKVRETFLTTPRDVYDINGEKVKEGVMPLEVTLAKDVALAKGEADTNSLGGDLMLEIEDLFTDMDISADKFFNYIKVSDMLSQMTPDEASGITNFSQWLESRF